MRHIQLFGVILYVSNKLLQVSWRKFFPCDNQFRYLKNCTNWLEIDIWLIRKVRVKRDRERMGSCVTHQDGIAVRSCAHCASRARGTAGPSDILNDELLPEQPRHVLADDASTDVSCPARSAAAPAARCRNCLRWGSFILNPPFTSFDHLVGDGEQRAYGLGQRPAFFCPGCKISFCTRQ